MKINISKTAILSLAILFVLAAPLGAAGRKLVIVASPFLEKSDREVAYREIGTYCVSDAAGGEEIIVLDGVRLEIIAQFTIPKGEVYRKNPNGRARVLAKSMASLRQFFAMDRPHTPTLGGTVLVPQALNLIVTHLRKATEAMTVVFLSSAFYADENGAYDMVGGYVPSDQHIRVASRESVFGTRDKGNDLQGVIVHYCFLREAFDHADHREAVHRFWYLFVGSQQGRLASFAASPSIVFHRVGAGMEDPIMQAKLDETDRELILRRVELRRKNKSGAAQTNDVPTETRQTRQSDVVTPSPITTPGVTLIPTNSEVLTRIIPNTIRAGRQGVGIVWSVRGRPHVAVDVDLYLKPGKPDAEEVWFRNTSTAGASYLRDILHAAGDTAYGEKNPQANWEWVDLDGDVPLRAGTTVWLNLFRNDSGEAVTGMIIVVSQGEVFQDHFRFPPNLTGDRRAHADHRSDNPHWINVDLSKLLTRGQG